MLLDQINCSEALTVSYALDPIDPRIDCNALAHSTCLSLLIISKVKCFNCPYTMLNATSHCDNASFLPSYALKPAPPLLPFLSDVSLSLWLPFIAYWAFSAIFQAIESSSLGSRLDPFNTPTELLMRNRVSKTYALFYILLNFAIQGTIAWALSKLGGEEFIGREEYDIAVWALRMRTVYTWVPRLLGVVGVDSLKLAANVVDTAPAVAAVLAGGKFQTPLVSTESTSCSGLTSWELSLASNIYYYFIPALQFFLAFNITDIWQYFGHRLLHEWRWLYRTAPKRLPPFSFPSLHSLAPSVHEQRKTADNPPRPCPLRSPSAVRALVLGSLLYAPCRVDPSRRHLCRSCLPGRPAHSKTGYVLYHHSDVQGVMRPRRIRDPLEPGIRISLRQ